MIRIYIPEILWIWSLPKHFNAANASDLLPRNVAREASYFCNLKAEVQTEFSTLCYR
jgi:hypothetical protein